MLGLSSVLPGNKARRRTAPLPALALVVASLSLAAGAGPVSAAAELGAPAAVDFGTLAPGAVVDRTVTVTNGGAAAVPVSSVALESAAPGFSILADGASGTSIPPGGSAAVVVRYAPTTAPSGTPAPAWRMYTNLAATYYYSGGVVSGATVYTGFENLGGTGSLTWRMTGCAPNTSDCVPKLDETGTIAVLGGARYLVEGDVALLPGSGRISWLAPVAETTALEGHPYDVTAVRYVRMADAFLSVYSSGEEAASTRLYGVAASSPAPTDPTVPGDASVHQPDLRISARKAGGYVGDDVYNATARTQTKVLTVRRARSRSWWVKVENDGTAADTYRVRGPAKAPGVRVRYLLGRKDVTAKLSAKAGLRVSLAAGKTKLVQVRTTVLSTARVGSRAPVKVTATYAGGVTRVDAVKAVVKVL